MLMSAKFRALSAIDPGLVGLKPHRGHVSRNHVFLPEEIGRPDAVNHVGRGSDDLDRLADRYVNLVGGADMIGRNRVHVLSFPPPLMTRDFDPDCILARK